MSRHLAFGVLALVLTGCTTALPSESVGPFKDSPQVQVVSPTEGQTLQGGDVTVKVTTTGKFRVVAAGDATDKHLYSEGHFHAFLDVTPTAPGEVTPKAPGITHFSTPEVVIHGVSSGRHTLYVELAFSDHIPYQQSLAGPIHFTVTGGSSAPAPAASASPAATASPSPVAAASPSPAAGGTIGATVSVAQGDPSVGGSFTPPSVSIKVGQAVEWNFNDPSAPHSVTSDDNGGFDSDVQQQGAKFSHTFDKAGTYAYHCSVHPAMTAKVIVS